MPLYTDIDNMKRIEKLEAETLRLNHVIVELQKRIEQLSLNAQQPTRAVATDYYY